MRRNNIHNSWQLKGILSLLLLLPLFSCNEKGSSDSSIDNTSLAVTSFSIKLNSMVSGLDSVYFAIDLNRGLIFNPDSLAPGTPIDKLVANIGYSSDVEKVIILQEGGTTREDEINYKKHPTDSIDFTGKVTLTLSKGELSKSYRLKVNVHNEYADSLRWDEVAMSTLPSRMSDPLSQKTVCLADTTAVSLIQEKDGTYTLSTSRNLIDNNWEKTAITLPFTPDIPSLSAANQTLYILDKAGHLFEGNTAGNWTDTGYIWDCIIGSYLDTAIGLSTMGDRTVFAQYPLTDLNTEAIVPTTFPRSGFSNFVTLKNKWTNSPVAFFVGGIKSDGTYSDDTWAFDGSEWIKLNSGGIPAVKGASIVPYYYYRTTASGSSLVEFSVWMLLGGRTSDGFNRTVYISYNNGVDWAKGSQLMQLPAEFPEMSNCDNIVMSTTKTASLSDNWKIISRSSKPNRLPYQVDGETITWECPYIYLIGGINADGILYNSIWRGVLSRLTFVPII